MSTAPTDAPAFPKIFVFCNACAPDWHVMLAIAEDGTTLASHICSHHGFAAHDMGIHPDGWKRDKYAAHYPQGFEVEWVEDAHPGKHAGVDLACERHLRSLAELAKGAGNG